MPIRLDYDINTYEINYNIVIQKFDVNELNFFIYAEWLQQNELGHMKLQTLG